MRILVQPLAALAAAPALALVFVSSATIAGPATLITAAALACIFGAWTQIERARLAALQRSAARERARNRASLLLRDGLLNSTREAAVVWESAESDFLSFSGGKELIGACLAGPDRAAVSAALDSLRRNGATFELEARTDKNQTMILRGCIIGSAAAVFLHRKDGTFRAGRSASADVSDGFIQALNHLGHAVAIFGPERRLAFYNQGFARLFELPTRWLDAQPQEGEILDRMRELRRLPEQSDFAAWKRAHLKLFAAAGDTLEEVWHLPNGSTLRVVAHRRPSGGFFYLYEDVSERLRQKSAYNALIKVQQATLDTLQEAVAVFGTDGRLKLYNRAFSQQWRLQEQDLTNSPHLNAIAQSCARRFGRDGTWERISRAVTSGSPVDHDGGGFCERSDGRVLSYALARLPDGATLITFADLTDSVRLESALAESPTASLRRT